MLLATTLTIALAIDLTRDLAAAITEEFSHNTRKKSDVSSLIEFINYLVSNRREVAWNFIL
jgi:hypothetical protein